MLFFILWVILIVGCIVAVPIAAKMSPKPAHQGGGSDSDNGMEAEAQPGMEYAAQEEVPVASQEFGADPNEFGAEPLGDDAFAEFN